MECRSPDWPNAECSPRVTGKGVCLLLENKCDLRLSIAAYLKGTRCQFLRELEMLNRRKQVAMCFGVRSSLIEDATGSKFTDYFGRLASGG